MSTRKKFKRHDFGDHSEKRFPYKGVLWYAIWECRRCGYVLRRAYSTFRKPTSRPEKHCPPKRRDCDVEIARRVMTD